jgi:2-amino-4-hydroxy-6-hydroxymethyldihydropteridine diphosphokinase
MAKTTAYIGLGGNVGDVIHSIRSALQHIDGNDKIDLLETSSVYKTPPWGVTEQAWFFNACASIKTSLTAHELLEVCLSIEQTLKRVRDVRWGPRTIDLDVLLFGNEEINEDKLQIPHPRMLERAFVLKPLSDIAPNMELQGIHINKWLEKLDSSQILKTDDRLTG